jgi:hypothetical protein
VSTPTLDRPAAEPAPALHVEVTWDPQGGWLVEARRGRRLVASRHCDDWHRVERARLALATEPQPASDGTPPAETR